MHIEAQRFIEQAARLMFPNARARINVVEFGSLDVNGGLRHLYPRASWLGIDFMPGPGVDIVADAGEWKPTGDPLPRGGYDLVICAEVLEHAPKWWEIIHTARSVVGIDGAFICTAATWPRPEHGAYDPDGTHGTLPGEHYENIDVGTLLDVLRADRFTWIDLTVDGRRGDVYVCARP